MPFALPAGSLATWPGWLPLAAAAMLAAVGLADDLKGLGLGIRLVAQTLALLALFAALAWGTRTDESDLGLLALVSGMPSIPAALAAHAPAWLGGALDILLVPVLVLGGLWWINLFNFMDGIDGLAASQALFMLVASIVLKLTGSGMEASFSDIVTAPAPAASSTPTIAMTTRTSINEKPGARRLAGNGGLIPS